MSLRQFYGGVGIEVVLHLLIPIDNGIINFVVVYNVIEKKLNSNMLLDPSCIIALYHNTHYALLYVYVTSCCMIVVFFQIIDAYYFIVR